jgi:hypothetical protein
MRTTLIALLASLAIAGSASAQDGVFPVKGTNLTEGEMAAIGAMITSAYATQKNARVYGPDDTGPVLAQAGTHRDAATQLNLNEYITIDAVRLEQRIAIHAVLYNKHGSQLYQTRTTAMSLDDLEIVSERIATSLHRRTEIEHTMTLDTVTGKEATRKNRMFAEKVIGIRTAVVVPLAPDLSADPMLLAQFDSRLEGETYFLEFAAGLMLPSQFDSDDGIGGLVGHLGGSLYLTHSSISPYVGAGVSPRLVFGGYSGAGLTANGHLGVMFMRHSSSRIYAEIRVDQNLLPLSPDYGYDDEIYNSETGTYEYVGTEDKIWPTEISLGVGIGW